MDIKIESFLDKYNIPVLVSFHGTDLIETDKIQLVFNYKAIQQILPFKKAIDLDMLKFVEYGYHDIELDPNRILQFYKSKFKNEVCLNDSILSL